MTLKDENVAPRQQFMTSEKQNAALQDMTTKKGATPPKAPEDRHDKNRATSKSAQDAKDNNGDTSSFYRSAADEKVSLASPSSPDFTESPSSPEFTESPPSPVFNPSPTYENVEYKDTASVREPSEKRSRSLSEVSENKKKKIKQPTVITSCKIV